MASTSSLLSRGQRSTASLSVRVCGAINDNVVGWLDARAHHTGAERQHEPATAPPPRLVRVLTSVGRGAASTCNLFISLLEIIKSN